MSAFTVRPEPFTSALARELAAEANAVNAERYGAPDRTLIEDDEFDAAHGGRFLIGYLIDPGGADRPVACGGFRRAEPPMPADTAEIKRMYVRASARRSGLGRAMLAALEAAAAEAGYATVVLDTGDRQPEAIALYESAGFARIPSYSIYRESPQNRAYAKSLSSVTGTPRA